MAESEYPTVQRKAKLNAVLFDAGGTLIYMPRKAEEMLADFCHQLGFSITPEQASGAYRASEQYYVQHYLGYTGDQGDFWHAYHGEALRCLGISDLDGQRAAFLSHGFGRAGVWQAYPEASATCESLIGMGLRLGVISNGSVTVRDLLEHAGLLPYFEVVIASQDLGIQKPDERIFHAALNRLGIGASEALYVGDLYEVDVIGARGAGLTAVLIDRDGGPERECPTIRSLDELIPIVQRLIRNEVELPEQDRQD